MPILTPTLSPLSPYLHLHLSRPSSRPHPLPTHSLPPSHLFHFASTHPPIHPRRPPNHPLTHQPNHPPPQPRPPTPPTAVIVTPASVASVTLRRVTARDPHYDTGPTTTGCEGSGERQEGRGDWGKGRGRGWEWGRVEEEEGRVGMCGEERKGEWMEWGAYGGEKGSGEGS